MMEVVEILATSCAPRLVLACATGYSSAACSRPKQLSCLMPKPFKRAHQKIDEILVNAKWVIQSYKHRTFAWAHLQKIPPLSPATSEQPEIVAELRLRPSVTEALGANVEADLKSCEMLHAAVLICTFSGQLVESRVASHKQ